MKMKEKNKEEKKKEIKIVGTRGRTFEGTVIKIHGLRAVVEFERTVRIPKYERFAKKKTKLHSKIPSNLSVHVGDYVRIRECRPLSKIMHFVVTDIVRRKE